MVVNPVTEMTKLFVVWALIEMACSVGATDGTVNCNVVGVVGLRGTPPLSVEKVGVKVMVPATVPVCNPTCVPWVPNTALVVLAGIVKLTVCPPVAN